MRSLARPFAATAALLLGASACHDSTSTSSLTSGPPVITAQPVSLTVAKGAPATLSIAVTGASPFSYQWYRDSVRLAGDTTSVLSIAATTYADSGTYFITVKNSLGSATSNTATIVVNPPTSPTAWRQDGGASSTTSKVYAATLDDESAVKVFDAGLLTATTPTITKTGNSTDLTATAAKGQNFATLAASGAHVTISSSFITASGVGAGGVFATDAGSQVALSGSVLFTAGASSPAFGASNGGALTVSGGAITTTSSPIFAAGLSPLGTAASSFTLQGGATVQPGNGQLITVAPSAATAVILDGVVVAGQVVVGAGSTLSLTIRNGATWTGTTNGGDLAFGSGSTWTVTGTSTVGAITGLTVNGAQVTNLIAGPSVAVSYDGGNAANAPLARRTYTLVGGGQLIPR